MIGFRLLSDGALKVVLLVKRPTGSDAQELTELVRYDAQDAPLVGLARRAAAGDRCATSAVLRAVGPRVLAVVRAVFGATHPDAPDVAQQALLSVVRALPAYRAECSPQAYAAAIATRTAIDARRRQRRERAHRTDADLELAATGADGPETLAVRARRLRVVRDVIAQLPPEQAEALAMRVLLGCSLQEISETSGVPSNTVRSRIRLAKEGVRRKLEGQPELAGLFDAEDLAS